MKLFPLLLLAACALAQTPPAAAPASGQTAPAPPALKDGLYAVFNTSMGSFTAELFEKDMPNTVRNFVGLARGTKPWKDQKTHQMVAKPLYTGLIFHRVIAGFMIQTGDPAGDGTGDCGFTIKDEPTPPTHKYDAPGKLGMANAGPNTGACQFFITDAPYPSLNGPYPLFGEVVQGQEVVDKIDHVPTKGPDNKPITPVRLISVTIKRVGAPATPVTKKAPPAATKTAPTKK
jgi:cyclophilin family peptidyl-prolyl cis-trans isomerase